MDTERTPYPSEIKSELRVGTAKSSNSPMKMLNKSIKKSHRNTPAILEESIQDPFPIMKKFSLKLLENFQQQD